MLIKLRSRYGLRAARTLAEVWFHFTFCQHVICVRCYFNYLKAGKIMGQKWRKEKLNWRLRMGAPLWATSNIVPRDFWRMSSILIFLNCICGHSTVFFCHIQAVCGSALSISHEKCLWSVQKMKFKFSILNKRQVYRFFMLKKTAI